MANLDSPRGLRPLGRTIQGGAPEHYPYTKGSGAVLYQWDAVKMVNGVIVRPATPGTDLYKGVYIGGPSLSTDTADVTIEHSAGSIFVAQASAGFAVANAGKNANLVIGSPDTVRKVSTDKIDSTTIATTASLDVHLLRLNRAVGNGFGNYALVEISWNKHADANVVAGQ